MRRPAGRFFYGLGLPGQSWQNRFLVMKRASVILSAAMDLSSSVAALPQNDSFPQYSSDFHAAGGEAMPEVG
jgi:hypothetical protein